MICARRKKYRHLRRIKRFKISVHAKQMRCNDVIKEPLSLTIIQFEFVPIDTSLIYRHFEF